MAETNIDEFAQVVYKKLREHHDLVSSSLCGGGAKDFANYNLLVGNLRGIDIAIDTLREVLGTTAED